MYLVLVSRFHKGAFLIYNKKIKHSHEKLSFKNANFFSLLVKLKSNSILKPKINNQKIKTRKKKIKNVSNPTGIFLSNFQYHFRNYFFVFYF